MSPNLLDFTTDGQAIINMPNYKEQLSRNDLPKTELSSARSAKQ